MELFALLIDIPTPPWKNESIAKKKTIDFASALKFYQT